MLSQINKLLGNLFFLIFLLYVLHCLKLTSEKLVLYGATQSLPQLWYKNIPKWLLFGNQQIEFGLRF